MGGGRHNPADVRSAPHHEIPGSDMKSVLQARSMEKLIGAPPKCMLQR